MTGMTDASATRRPLTPKTRRDGSTTALPPAAAAIEQVPTFALPECTVSRMNASAQQDKLLSHFPVRLRNLPGFGIVACEGVDAAGVFTRPFT